MNGTIPFLANEKDFNYIREWLLPMLSDRGQSVEQFARKCGLSRASLYFYLVDKTRPESSTMKKMCEVLGVPFEEGLAQYSPKKIGRPIH